MRDTGLALGRQLRAARVLAGLEQIELARSARLHVNSIRRLERMPVIPASSWHAAGRVVEALGTHGVEVVASPTPAVRLAHVGKPELSPSDSFADQYARVRELL